MGNNVTQKLKYKESKETGLATLWMKLRRAGYYNFPMKPLNWLGQNEMLKLYESQVESV